MTKEQLFKKYNINESHNTWDNSIDNWMSIEIYRLIRKNELPPENDSSVQWIIEFLDKKDDMDWWTKNVMSRPDWGSLYLTAKRMVYQFADKLIDKPKAIPILYSTEMVQSILEGRKTQTRRDKNLDKVNDFDFYSKGFIDDELIFEFDGYDDLNDRVIFEYIKSPYGKPGDILWVRETFQLETPYGPEDYYFGYKINSGIKIKASEKYDFDISYKWKPSIFMPKEACRLFLKIKDIRVERLNDISHADAIAEGIEVIKKLEDVILYKDYNDASHFFQRADYSFCSLWEKINGKGSWKANPWVWVIEFEKIAKPEGWPW